MKKKRKSRGKTIYIKVPPGARVVTRCSTGSSTTTKRRPKRASKPKRRLPPRAKNGRFRKKKRSSGLGI